MLVPILDFDHQVYANGARRAQQRPRRGVGCKAGEAGASLARRTVNLSLIDRQNPVQPTVIIGHGDVAVEYNLAVQR